MCTRTAYVTLSVLLLPCSHYRVYVVRLGTNSLPSDHPDSLFLESGGSQLSTIEVVNSNDPFRDGTPFLGYIAYETEASKFEPLFTIGDESLSDVANFTNGKLRSNSLYTFFLRAYPKTRENVSFRAKRQGSTSSRQYVVFSSSSFSAISKTGTCTCMQD